MTSTLDSISKSDFAQMCGVTPGRVSQWINEGKIDPQALEGEGRYAKVNVPLASRQLRERLDVNQRFGMNGLNTNLSLFEEPCQSLPGNTDAIEERIKQEKLRQAEFTTRKLERADREALGFYMRTSEARAEMARLGSMMLAQFEGALAEFAGALSAQYNLVNRDVLHLLRQEFRKVRERTAASFAQKAQMEDTCVTEAEP